MDIKPDIGMEDRAVSPLLGKRKRSSDEADTFDSDVDDNEESSFLPDDAFIVPEGDSEEDDDEFRGSDDDDSDNDLQDNDMIQEPYSESVEAYPAYAAYDPDIADITRKLISVPQQIIDILSQHEGSGKHVISLVEAASKLLTIPKNAKIRVGLLGDAGAGKSSLLNSITDLDDLANSLSGGQSCTCVPTEYSGAFLKQRKAFAATIRYFDIKKIGQMLRGMLEDYNVFVFENDRDWDEDQRTLFKRAMQNALKTFRVLFCDLDQFKDDQAAKEYLKSNYEDKAVNVISMFLESCEKKLKDKITFDNGYAEFIETSTRIKLRDMIDPLTGARARSDRPALWPLVRCARYVAIRLSLQSPLMLR